RKRRDGFIGYRWEAEWEYACGAGSTIRFFTGDDPSTLGGYANVADLTAKKQFPDGRLSNSMMGMCTHRRWDRFSRTRGGYMISSATFGSGVAIGGMK